MVWEGIPGLVSAAFFAIVIGLIAIASIDGQVRR